MWLRSGGRTVAAGDSARRLARTQLTLWTAAVMTVINGVMWTSTAYALRALSLLGQRCTNAVTTRCRQFHPLVTGVMLVALYAPQQVRVAGLPHWNLSIIFAPPGIILALLFVTFPLWCGRSSRCCTASTAARKTAAASLGAGEGTIWRITLPPLWQPIAAGALLSFARAIGEFGAIVIVVGNILLKSQTAAVHVLGEVGVGEPAGASAISLVMIAIVFG